MAQTYTIQPGDTLLKVAQAAGLSVQQLLSANGIDDPNKIMAGDTLVIPAAITGPSLSDEQRNAIASAQQYVGTHGQGDDVRQYYKEQGLTDDQIDTIFQMTAKNAEDYNKAVTEQQAAYEAEQEDAPWWQGALRVGSALLNLPGHAIWGGIRFATDDDYTAGDYLQGFYDGGKSTVASDVLAKGRDKDVLTGIMDVALAPTSMFAVGNTVRKYIPVANGYRKVGNQSYIKVLGRNRADAPIREAAKRGHSLVEVKGAKTARMAAERELTANHHFQNATKRQQAELLRRADERVAKQFIDTPNGELIMVRNSKGMPVAAREVGPSKYMLGHNNLGYAAMVGGRQQMSGLSRTMDPLPLLTYGVHDQVPFVVDQSKIPVTPYRQDLDVENYGSSDFQAAFREARAAGLPTFQYNGQVFTTDVASDIPTRQVAAMPVVAADGTVAVSPEAAYTVANGQGIVGAGDVYVPNDAGELSGDLVYMVE